MEIEAVFYHEVPIAWDSQGPIEWEELELVAHVDVEPCRPAVTWGPADNWRPAEGGTNVNLITLNGEEWTGVLDKLGQQRLEDAVIQATEDALEEPEPDYDDDFYYDYDDGREVQWEAPL